MNPNKQLTIEETQELIKHKLFLLTDRHDEFKKIIDDSLKKSSYSIIRLIINTILSDLIYNKFEWEEEDHLSLISNECKL